MEKKLTPANDPGKLSAGFGGGSLPKGGGGNFSLPKERGPVKFEIWRRGDSFKPAHKVSEARTSKGGRRAVDRHDTAYGAAAHYLKRLFPDE